MIRVLNVAEKNDAAKSIAAIMSRGQSQMRQGFSKFNKIYDFDIQHPRFFDNKQVKMIMTSVSGHLLASEFTGEYKSWKMCSPVELFDARVEKTCPKDYEDIKRTLEREVKSCTKLIIWTDCDREGENIGFEIIQVCKAIKLNLDVYRANFSEITQPAIQRAITNLSRPNPLINDAVEARIELDLRIGAAFTRFQTLRIQRKFPGLCENVVSYGSCQFPTLGFVVERFKSREEFMPEPFWKIIPRHKVDGSQVEFAWDRVRLFDYTACSVFYETILANPLAKVIDIKTKPKSKWRPCALDTIELEKLSSRKLKLNAKETMKIAEKLYTQGFISYPRTETNMFPKEFDLASLVQKHVEDNGWGEFAQRILERGPNPRNGTKSDQAHPPIHPLKAAPNLTGNEQRVYEFIVRHFLACLSDDAKGQETTVTIDINNEKFTASGLMITERNYLEVYPYEKWSDKEIPVFRHGETFTPSEIELKEGTTVAPPLLTEADLISLMEKHGIGTDATHADHIETIKERGYVTLNNENRFLPDSLGLGLVEGYDLMGYAMSKPHLRAALEEDLKMIIEGKKGKDQVLREQVAAYRAVFVDACENVIKLDEALSVYFGQPTQIDNDEGNSTVHYEPSEPVLECYCKAQMCLKSKKDNKGFYIGCRGYPDCRNSIWLPNNVQEAQVTKDHCDKCKPKRVKLLKFKFERGSVPPHIPQEYTTCILCDDELRESLQIQIKSNLNETRSLNPSSKITTIQISSRPSGAPHITARPVAVPVMARPIAVPQRHRNNSLDNSGNDETQAICCHCSIIAALKTVRKEGTNQGKQFYSCGNQGSCDFFAWKDAVESNQTSFTQPRQQFIAGSVGSSRNDNRGSFGASSNAIGSGVNCTCGKPALILVTKKPGPNLGRKFYKCDECKFFEWESNEVGNENGITRDISSNGGGGGSRQPFSTQNFQNISRNNSNDGPAQKKRKCGVCGVEGHNKKNCPNVP